MNKPLPQGRFGKDYRNNHDRIFGHKLPYVIADEVPEYDGPIAAAIGPSGPPIYAKDCAELAAKCSKLIGDFDTIRGPGPEPVEVFDKEEARRASREDDGYHGYITDQLQAALAEIERLEGIIARSLSYADLAKRAVTFTPIDDQTEATETVQKFDCETCRDEGFIDESIGGTGTGATCTETPCPDCKDHGP